MNFARGSTDGRNGDPACRVAKWTATVMGLGLAFQAIAAPLVVPEGVPFAPGGAIPLLSTPEGLRPGAAPATPARSQQPVSWDLPLSFEPADHRAPADAGFMARGPGYSVYVGSAGAILALQRGNSGDAQPRSAGASRRERLSGRGADAQLVRMRLEGAREGAAVRTEGTLPGRIHRLLGSDSSKWVTGLQAHRRVVFAEVYPGVDVAYYGKGRELEFDFIVAPGASPSPARLRFDGVQAVKVDATGDLHLETSAGRLTQRRPVAYQEGLKGRESVEAAYAVRDDGTVGFELGTYDPARPLVIDPVLSYATFLGGTGLDQCWDIAVDGAGFAYVVGETESAKFSSLRIVSTNVLQAQYQGGEPNVAGDAFVAKLNPDGTAFEWFTYLGGSDMDIAYCIALGTGNEPVVGGFTTSTNFPISAGAYQTSLNGITNRFTGRKPLEGFVTRLKADGSGIRTSTLFGGEGEEQVIDLVLTADQSVVAVGSTTSTNLPVRGAGAGTSGGGTDGFLIVLSADGTALLNSRYIGGSGRDSAEGVALGLGGTTAHVVGITGSTNFPVVGSLQSTNAGLFDAFVAGFRVADGATEYATYLGGDSDDYAYRVSVAPAGQVWVAGVTFSTNLPVVGALTSTNSGFSDAFVSRLSANGQTLEMSTYYGGSASDSFWDVQVDAAGRVHLVGETASPLLPGRDTNQMYSTNLGLSDILVVRLGTDGTISQQYYGAAGDELAYAVAADAAGNSYLAGRVRSVNFPVSSTNVAQAVYGGDRTDGFVLKFAYEPQLSAQLASEGVRLSWPAPNAGFALESAPVEGFTGTWTREASPVSTVNGRHSVLLPMTATNSVFRLRWER